MSVLSCAAGGKRHVVEFPEGVEERPEQVICRGCGKVFVRDDSWRQGYRPQELSIEYGSTPVCLRCWRVRLGQMNDDPVRKLGWPEDTCSICKQRTNHGIYLSDEQIEALLTDERG